MITVNKLIELLSVYSGEAEVIFSDGTEIKNIVNDNQGRIILSNHKALGECVKCNNPVYKTPVKGYAGFCPCCDEDLYNIEINPL